MESQASGTIVFTTVGRTEYGFDIFSVPLTDMSTSTELRLTDGISINYNAQFLDDNQTLLFISERTGIPTIYLTRPNSSPEQLPSAPGSLFHDRPILHHNTLTLFFISAHQPPSSLYKSWSALYSTSIIPDQNQNQIHRLTPLDSADFSPSLSPSGKYIAVASYGSKPWGGEFHELDTQIVVFPLSDPSQRTVLAQRGGWPTWSGDTTLYFHCQSDDGWWSIYRVDFSEATTAPPLPLRLTPPGLHAFTPAALQDGKRIAIATRRKDRQHRHIEIFDTESGKFEPVTELINPEIHHYNPFVSPGSKFLGYHRFRGGSGQNFIPNLEPVLSPINSLKMLRINGQFPAFSPNGDLIAYNHDFDSKGGLDIIKSDGSKRWKLIKGQIAFYNSWSPCSDMNKHVIFTSLGSIFQPPEATVQVARVTFQFDASCSEISDVEVKLLTKQETGNNGFPACSPDGKTVVFRSGRSGHKNLYIMDALDGEDKKIRQLTEGPWIDTMPSWSPDGEWIAFSSNRHDPSNPVTFGIYLVRADGSELRRVHVEGSRDVAMERINHVCFSPNGEWLLFTTNMGGVTAEPVSLPNQFQPYGDLFIVKTDGSGLRRLTWNGYENGTPAWHANKLELPNLSSINGKDCEELKGQFQEPLWITCDL